MSKTSELTHLFRELEAPAAARALPKLADRARAEEWSSESLPKPCSRPKTHLAIALGIRACFVGQRAIFKTATEWVALLAEQQRQGRLDEELKRLERYPLLICDEVGNIPFDPQAANLMFMLVSRRYERASLIVTSNKPFGAWGEIFGDEITAAALVDRLVHHAEIPFPQRRQLPPQRPRPRVTPTEN